MLFSGENMVQEFLKQVEAGPYAWPGGYPVYFVTMGGDVLSWDAVSENKNLIVENMKMRLQNDYYDCDWVVVGAEINYEDTSLYCAHTGERIPSAYCDED